jgi:hypothetical protein
MTTDQSNRILEEEIAVIREEMRDLESSIQQSQRSTLNTKGPKIRDSGLRKIVRSLLHKKVV